MKNAGLILSFVVIAVSATIDSALASLLGPDNIGPQSYLAKAILLGIIISVGTAFWMIIRLHRAKKRLEQEIEKHKASMEICCESDQRYHAFFNRAQAGVFIIDSETHMIMDVNASALNMIGLEKEMVIGRKYDQFMSLDCGDVSGPAAHADLTEMELAASNGRKLSVMRRIIPVMIRGRRNFMVSHIDVTQLKQTRSDLEVALAAAKAANVMKGEFLANMSHEIRTPMNGIIGMTNIMLNTELDSDQLEYMQIIRNSADSLLRIVNDILDFSKIEAGTLEIDKHEFDIQSTIESAVDTVACTAHEKGLEFTFLIDPAVPNRLVGDDGRLKQVLLNLLNNAIKFTHQGEVFLHVTLEEKEAFFTTLKFIIKDTGIGIPADQTDYIFRAFSQVDASTTRNYGGTGLGLAISKNIVEMMNGRIDVQSEPGQGSIFTFTAKFQRPAPSENKSPMLPLHQLSGAAVADKRILCVDDNKTNLFVLKGYLEYWNLKFSLAQSGPQALAMLRQAVREKDPYHLVIIDHMMPEMDGEALGTAIRGDSSIMLTRMVMLTSIDGRINIERLDKIGFDGYLSKPIHMKHFHNCLLLVFNKEKTASPQAMAKDQGIITKGMVDQSISNGFRILVVEDNFINQQIVTKILSLHGYQSEVANNGRDAIRMLASKKYDLVLMDIQMPLMNGLEATAAIRDPAGSCKNPNVPVVALTANVMAGDRQMCLKAGVDDYLAKPVSPNVLISTIEGFLLKPGEAQVPACKM